MHETPAYRLWSLVIINSAVFIFFALSFFKPRTARDWRTFGTFSAFIVALFVEMYGFPLTICLLSGWLVRRYPGLDLLGHDAGHLWYTLLGLKGDPHTNALHLVSNVPRRWIHFAVSRLACAVHGSKRRARSRRWVRTLNPPSAIRRVHADHVRVPAPMADAADARDVSDSRDAVRPARTS